MGDLINWSLSPVLSFLSRLFVALAWALVLSVTMYANLVINFTMTVSRNEVETELWALVLLISLSITVATTGPLFDPDSSLARLFRAVCKPLENAVEGYDVVAEAEAPGPSTRPQSPTPSQAKAKVTARLNSDTTLVRGYRYAVGTVLNFALAAFMAHFYLGYMDYTDESAMSKATTAPLFNPIEMEFMQGVTMVIASVFGLFSAYDLAALVLVYCFGGSSSSSGSGNNKSKKAKASNAKGSTELLNLNPQQPRQQQKPKQSAVTVVSPPVLPASVGSFKPSASQHQLHMNV